MTALLLALIVAQPAAVIVRHDRTDEATIKAGMPFRMVGLVPAGAGCTLIAPSWAITAAHVARSIRPDDVIRFDDVRAVVKRVVIHPEGSSPRPGVPPQVDLALVEFVAPVAGVPYAALYRTSDENGQLVHIVGYGDHGVPGSKLLSADGRRRAVTNHVSRVGPLRLMVSFDEPPAGSPLEGIGAPGDSGGPALIVTSNATLIAGVSSGSMGPPNQYGTIDVYTRISTHIPWIEETMRRFSQ